MKSKKRPQKHANLLALIQRHLAGTYLDTRHAFDRKHQRGVTLPEILYVLRNGYHEKKKDEYKDEYQAWNYAVRGKTVDRRELRVCISFDENGMLIITTIDLDAKD